jgi:anti-sigma factor RsiW
MTCRDHEVLLSLRATGALDAAERARVEGHLAGCAACRAEADDLAATLELVKLPPASEAERRVLDELPARTLAAVRRSTRVRSVGTRIAVAVVAAAAAAAVALAPAVLRRDAAVPAQATAAAWEQPDLDVIWNDTSVIDLDASVAAGDDGTDAALAALDL